VIGTGSKKGKKASRNWLLRLAFRMSGRLDSNQRPPEPHSGSHATQVDSRKQDVAALPTVCTSVCTNGGEQDKTDPLAALAAALLSLSSADRARLAAVLLGQPEGGGPADVKS
jgi:hypothetical protein